MSAFVVEDKTINGPVTFLADSEWARAMIRTATGFNLATPDGRAALAQAMFALNCNAIEQRYGVGQAAEFRPLDFRYEPVEVPAVQAVKNLRCWIYQCSEGDVPDTSPLYQVMDKVTSMPLFAAMQRSAAYEQAEW